MNALNMIGIMTVAAAIFSGSVRAGSEEHHHSAEAKSKTTASKSATIEQKICPVMGGDIDASVYTDYKGKRIYFCCAGCIPEFNKNPEKYLKIIADNATASQKADSAKTASQAPASAKPATESQKLVVQKTCPVMAGSPIDKKVFEDYKGQRVYFCCEGCRAPFKKDPEKYLKKLTELGEKPAKI